MFQYFLLTFIKKSAAITDFTTQKLVTTCSLNITELTHQAKNQNHFLLPYSKKKRTVCIYFTILFLQGKRLGSFIKILRLRNEWENFLVSYHFV